MLRVSDVDDGGNVWAVPERWDADAAPMPRLRVRERGKRSALGIGDRILARTEEAGKGWIAHPMKQLAKGDELMLGVLRKEGNGLWLEGVEKRERRQYPVSDAGDAEPGDLVLAEKAGRPPRITVRVTERLGDPFAPRSFSLIAIHEHGIPDVFADEALDEAERVAKLAADAASGVAKRCLSRTSPDRRDRLPPIARDHDDAVWAAPDDDPGIAGGWKAVVAIADVSFYVRPGSAIDREARRRGNSVYFPDRVVPMLPEIFRRRFAASRPARTARRSRAICRSARTASSRAGASPARWSGSRRTSRTRMRRRRWTHGHPSESSGRAKARHRRERPSFAGRGRIETALNPLWACWRALAKARDAREPLDLDLPERRVVLDEKGRIMSVAPRERLDAHRLIEDYMIAANVAAAKALEAKKAPVMYRIHEPPSREKLVGAQGLSRNLRRQAGAGAGDPPRDVQPYPRQDRRGRISGRK